MKLLTGALPPILVESSGYEGVRRIAETVAGDFEQVFGEKPVVISEDGLSPNLPRLILCATYGKSPLMERFVEEGMIEPVPGRERYRIKLILGSDLAQEVLLICGSDKRGTIYGMFSLSEYLGVTPLCYWGDVSPIKRREMEIGRDIEIISKEPSVRYRGFFINDEWPCFGTWANKHFGGFNAACYEKVFEFLLRMKGNYLWPAMWSAAFPLDGPGSANEELADLYGVVIGFSHHEPCLRSSEEWKKVCGPKSPYGSRWDFRTNEAGLTRYWEDSLKRSGKYENMITIGMRGEYDSRLLGPDSTVRENVELLKHVITTQRDLIRRYVHREDREQPLMLALYKEVEPYFYGDATTEGLKDWEGLEDVICMLCEDNFGQMRSLPPKEMRGRKGGFGMYYHFDYHGGPVSYEWVDSTPLTRTWEQMCQAYEYGIRDLWIVNVGDVKFHEVPLTYFMALAWDYDRWGISNPNSPREFTRLWAQTCFPEAKEETQEEIGRILTEYIDLNALRRPEALHPEVYHPCHYEETDRMIKRAEDLEQRSLQVMRSLTEKEAEAYFSMVHFPAMASMNLLKMHLYAGKNHLYAGQGRVRANRYGDLTAACIRKDDDLIKQWSSFLDGKWDGMQLASHIGFTKWNEDDCRYPVTMHVEPLRKPVMSVSRADEEETATRNYDAPMVIDVPDFLYAGCDQVHLEIANTGNVSFSYRIESATDEEIPDWLLISPASGKVEEMETVTLTCIREKLPKEEQDVHLMITDGDTRVDVLVRGRKAESADLPSGTYLQQMGVITMEASGYCRKKGDFTLLAGYGKYGSALKALPCTADYSQKEEKPEATYRFFIEKEDRYQISLLTAPTNSPVYGRGIHMGLRLEKGEQCLEEILTLIPDDFKAGECSDPRWCQGVLDQERRTAWEVSLDPGVWELTLKAMEAGAVPERILISAPGALKPSYLGPKESYRT